MKISESFEKEYLVAGNTYDNFLFENCPKEFLNLAISKLKESVEGVKCCVVCLDRQQEKLVELTLREGANDFQKKVLARDFVTAMIMRELLSPTSESYQFACRQIKAFMDNDFGAVKKMHTESFMPYDVRRVAKNVGKIELNFVLDGTQNKHLQQAINLFVSSREPYSVKIFTSNEKLSTYCDLNGVMIECPHDFMQRDVNKYIKQEKTIEKK